MTKTSVQGQRGIPSQRECEGTLVLNHLQIPRIKEHKQQIWTQEGKYIFRIFEGKGMKKIGGIQ